MEWIDSAAFDVLKLLAPGFIAAWVLYGLTADRDWSDLQRVIQALIFSIFIQVILGLLHESCLYVGRWHSIGEWSRATELASSVVLALLFGLLLAWLVNTDRLYHSLRRLGVTNHTSRPSVWYSAFKDHQDTYVVLELQDGRRIQGWPSEWPSLPGKGHIKLEDPIWLQVEENGKQKEIPVSGSTFILFSVPDVRWIEFQPRASIGAQVAANGQQA